LPKDKRIVPEDYFRVLKQRKDADSRKSRPATATLAANKSKIDSERDQSPDRYGPYLQHLINLIHPDMDEEEALSLIELPDETIYVIDKVVR